MYANCVATFTLSFQFLLTGFFSLTRELDKDGNILFPGEVVARFPYRSLLYYAYSFCSERTIEVTMDGLWGLLALFY